MRSRICPIQKLASWISHRCSLEAWRYRILCVRATQMGTNMHFHAMFFCLGRYGIDNPKPAKCNVRRSVFLSQQGLSCCAGMGMPLHRHTVLAGIFGLPRQAPKSQCVWKYSCVVCTIRYENHLFFNWHILPLCQSPYKHDFQHIPLFNVCGKHLSSDSSELLPTFGVWRNVPVQYKLI